MLNAPPSVWEDKYKDKKTNKYNAHPSVWEDMYEVGGSVAQIILNMGEHHSWYSGYLLVLLLFSIVTY